MIEGKTKSGFEFSIDENVMNDMRLVDVICELTDGGNKLLISKALTLLLGDNKKKLYDHVAEEDGRVPMEKIEEEITDIFKAFGPAGKN